MKTLLIILALLMALLFSPIARANPSHLEGYQIVETGFCDTPAGTLPCAKLKRENDAGTYYAFLTPDGQEVWLIIRVEGDKIEVIYEKRD